MTEKELKQLNRRQLLELLLLQTERADQLQQQLEQTRAKLESRDITIVESGSLAEASLKISGFFEAAQSAADGYLENIRRLEAEARQRAQAMIEEAEQQCQQRKQEADDYWAETNERIKRQCELLNELFGKGTQDT